MFNNAIFSFQALREVYKSKSNIVILDCSKETLESVLIQAQQVSIVSESYFYLLTSLDAHTVNLEPFKVKNGLRRVISGEGLLLRS